MNSATLLTVFALMFTCIYCNEKGLGSIQNVNNNENPHVNWVDSSATKSGRFPNSREWVLFANGEALYWKPTVLGLELALLTDTTSSSVMGAITTYTTTSTSQLFNPNFEFEWGFRVGLGGFVPHDDWDIYANWTRFYATASVSVSTEENPALSLSSYWTDPVFQNVFPHDGNAPSYSPISGHGTWKLRLNLLDAELGKKFFVSKWLTLRPSIGLRGGLVFQKYDQFFLATGTDQIPPNNLLRATDTLKMKNNFRGGGLLTCLNAQWGAFQEVSFYSNFAISILYGSFKLNRDGQIEGEIHDPMGTSLLETDSSSLFYSDHFLCSRYIADLTLGIKWDHMFAKNKLHLGINLGWEEHLYFGQNQFIRTQGAIASARNDLAVSGWTFGSRLDF